MREKHYEVRTYVYCFISEGACTESKYGVPLDFMCKDCKLYQEWKKGNRKIRKY